MPTEKKDNDRPLIAPFQSPSQFYPDTGLILNDQTLLHQTDTLYVKTSLNDSNSALSSPVSPEFDSITELPSPVVSTLTSPTPSLLDGYSSAGSSRIPTSPPKKSYGSLTSRPSAVSRLSLTYNNRIVSEYPNNHSSSSQKRNVSSPLQPSFLGGLERENHIESLKPTAEELDRCIFEGRDIDNVLHKWREVRTIGKGNFSTVVLAEELNSNDHTSIMENVAVKIVALPTKKETRNRIESSLKRELELLKVIRHPSIINLLAVDTSKDRILIILPYLPGGDLFELANKHRSRMSPLLIRHIFAEIAIGICYLHHFNIVHRDIKLENILLNYDVETLLSCTDFKNKKFIRITDFGLSRKIDPEDPLLTTRCGSEDYVPPELLIGLPYDGRQTDSWALGVLLYSIMEGRLPFDPPPNRTIRGRVSKVSHRIARIDWRWYQFADEFKDVKWKEEDWKDAKEIVQNLLTKREKRLKSREICERSWVDGVLDDEFKNFRDLKGLV